MTSRILVLVGALALLLANAGPVFGQAATGSITGTLMDETGAVVPGADIVVTHEGTGVTRSTVANAEGFFVVTALPAGTYTLAVEMPGFARWERTGIVVRTGDRINVPGIEMKVGTIAGEVTVTAAQDIMVPVDSGDKAQIITEGQIRNLSVAGRSAVELLKILPGVVFQPGSDSADLTGTQRGVGGINVSGTREDALDIVSDGANVIDPGCNCGTIVTPNVDMVQEVKVQTANFSAENNKGPAVINTVSKAGTSEFHGSLYTYLRHHRLNSQDWRANRFGTEKPSDRFVFWGGTLGGPLLIPGTNFNRNRDKLFFFAGVEFWNQDIDLGVFESWVPTQSMRQGDFSELAASDYFNMWEIMDPPCAPQGDNPLPGHCSSAFRLNPASIDPGGQILTNLLPLPNRDPRQFNGFNFVSSFVRPTNRRMQLVRLDYNISESTMLYTRFNNESENSPHPYTFWWNENFQVPYPSRILQKDTSVSSSTSLVNVLSPTTTNEIVFAVSYLNLPNEYEDFSKVSASALGYPYSGIYDNEGVTVPGITNWSNGIPTMLQPGGFDPSLFAKKWIVSASENFSKVVGTHSLKFGVFFQLTTNDQPTSGFDQGLAVPTRWGGNTSENAFADLMLGWMGTFEQVTKNIVGEMRQKEFTFFAQDNWKVTPRLTLEVGARFYHYGFMYDKNGFIATFDANRYDPNAPVSAYSGILAPHLGDDVPRSGFKTPALRVGPRFGFAYDLFGTGRSVIRGGLGTFYYRDQGNVYFGAIGNPPLVLSTSIGFAAGSLADIDQIDGFSNPQPPNLNVLDSNDTNIPVTHSWSLTWSQRMPNDILLETSYVGNTSRNQISPDGYNINVVPEGAMFGFPLGTDENAYRPFRNYGNINFRSHFLTQHYHSLQMLASRQTGRFNYQGSYTFGKVLGVGGGFFGGTPVDNFDMRRRSYGPLNYDRTHTLAVAYNFMVPDPVQNRFLGVFANGWQFSGISQFQSGGPFGLSVSGTMADGDSISAITVAGTPNTPARPFLTCDPRKGLQDGQYVNPSCFSAPSPGNNGHYQIPYIKRPGFQNHDLSVFKNFQIGSNEDHRLQFRASAFNFLNHPIPIIIGGNETTLNFANGEVTQFTLENLGQPQTKRGRRLFQLALRFEF